MAGAERARRGIVARDPLGPGPLSPRRRDRHPATGLRVVPEIGQRLARQEAGGLLTAVKARSISIGIGKAIVVDGVAPSSSRVCR